MNYLLLPLDYQSRYQVPKDFLNNQMFWQLTTTFFSGMAYRGDVEFIGIAAKTLVHM